MTIPLDTWRRSVGYNPYHFWQQANSLVPVTSACNTLIYQYAWQALDQAGRDDIQQAINEAHENLRQWLFFRVGEQYVTKRLQYPLTQTDQYQTWQGNGRLRIVNAGEGFIKAMGIPLYTPLEEDTPVTYSDEDGDGVDDTFTITGTVPAGLAYDRLIVAFSAADWLAEWGLEDAEIQPVKLTLNGVNLTVTGSSYLLVRRINYEGASAVKLIEPGEAAGSYRTYEVRNGALVTTGVRQ
jgi:hypothetical protein